MYDAQSHFLCVNVVKVDKKCNTPAYLISGQLVSVSGPPEARGQCSVINNWAGVKSEEE